MFKWCVLNVSVLSSSNHSQSPTYIFLALLLIVPPIDYCFLSQRPAKLAKYHSYLKYVGKKHSFENYWEYITFSSTRER